MHSHLLARHDLAPTQISSIRFFPPTHLDLLPALHIFQHKAHYIWALKQVFQGSGHVPKPAEFKEHLDNVLRHKV